MYALKPKGKFQFYCLAQNEQGLDLKIKQSFSNWLGVQTKGSKKTFDDFMENHDRVKVTIKNI